MFLPLLESQASSSSGADRPAAINPTISHSVSWCSSLANSTDTDQHSGEFARSSGESSFLTSITLQALPVLVGHIAAHLMCNKVKALYKD